MSWKEKDYSKRSARKANHRYLKLSVESLACFRGLTPWLSRAPSVGLKPVVRRHRSSQGAYRGQELSCQTFRHLPKHPSVMTVQVHSVSALFLRVNIVSIIPKDRGDILPRTRYPAKFGCHIDIRPQGPLRERKRFLGLRIYWRSLRMEEWRLVSQQVRSRNEKGFE